MENYQIENPFAFNLNFGSRQVAFLQNVIPGTFYNLYLRCRVCLGYLLPNLFNFLIEIVKNRSIF